MAHRKLMLPSFHGRQMDGYAELIVEVARREIATWPIDERFALWPRMQKISSEVLMRAVFGALDSERLKRLQQRPQASDRMAQRSAAAGADDRGGAALAVAQRRAFAP